MLIIVPLFSPTRAHNPWSTAGFDSGHIDDDDRLSFMHLYKAKAIIVGVVENP